MTDQSSEQPLVQHLLELRTRILKSLIAVIVVFAALFGFANDIYEFIALPLQKFLPENSQMVAINLTSNFLTPFRLTLLVSVFISTPFILFQIWSFIAPALYKNEKRIAVPLFVSSVLLFYSGMAFAYFVVFPLVFKFLIGVAPESVLPTPDMHEYLNLVIKLLFGFGLAFEVPVATVMLIAAGLVSPKDLSKKRPYVIVACFVMGMFLTPPDIISQVLLAIPMWLLFEVGLFFGRLIVKENPEQEEQADTQ